MLKRSNNIIGALIYISTLSLLITPGKSQVVCSEDELVKEILEDITDNGKLDCLRKSVSPSAAEETPEETRRRIEAEWKSDCSFEAKDDDWVKPLIKNYELHKGLVDVNGNKVENDFEDQADMCEIIRALIANGKIPEVGEDVTSIDPKVIDSIDCPGNEGQTEVCAVNPGSFAEKDKWYILLDGRTITIGGEPKYSIASKK